MKKEYIASVVRMKKGYTGKVLFLILKAKFVAYWKTIVILINNVAYDAMTLVSRLFDVVKLVLLLIFGFVMVPVMLFLCPVILPFYLLVSTFFQFDKFKKYQEDPMLNIPKRKRHQKYSIDKSRKSRR